MCRLGNLAVALALGLALAEASCSLQSGVDFVGNDIANTAATKAEDCCSKCQETAGCNAFTFTSYHGGTCWLKSGKGATQSNGDATSAVVVAECTLETGVDIVGNDLKNVKASKAEDCCSECHKVSGCKAFTWTGYDGGTCWLKNSKSSTSINAGAVSGSFGATTSAPTTTPIPTTTATPTTAPVSTSTIAKAVADYMVKTWPALQLDDPNCGSTCFSLQYATVPPTPRPKGWEYTYGVPMSALWRLYEKTNDTTYRDYVKAYVDKYVQANGSIPLSLSQDSMQATILLPGIYDETKDQRYLTAMSLVRGEIDLFPKNTGGAFSHKPANAYQQWLDGLYMTEPFLATYAAKYADQVKSGDSATAFQTVADQFIIAHEKLFDPVKKLHYHAWLGAENMTWIGIAKFFQPYDGQVRSQFFWGRSIGWYFMSLLDVLDFIPKNHTSRAKLEEIFKLLAEGLVAQQDEKTGLWYQILDVRNDNLPANGGYPNENITALPNWLETSASALFTYGLSKGIRKGLLPCSMRSAALKGWEGIKTQVVINGTDVTVKNTVVGMGVAATYNAYVNADFRTDLNSGPVPADPLTCNQTLWVQYQSLPSSCKWIFVRDNVPQGIGAVIIASIETEIMAAERDAMCDVKPTQTPTPACTVQTGVDYTGNDLTSVAGTSDDCCSKCQQTKGCGAYTWTSYNSGTCWLKTGKGVASKNAGAVSGIVSSSSGTQA